MSTEPMPFSEWLSTARGARRVSQQRLADETGIDRGHISKLENGRIGLPRHETRAKIHRVLGTSDDDLVAAGILEKRVFRSIDGDREVTLYVAAGERDAPAGESPTPSSQDALARLHERIDPALREVARYPEIEERFFQIVINAAALHAGTSPPQSTTIDAADDEESPPAPVEAPSAREDR